MQIGFIGLGNLGTVMVSNLIKRGHELHVYNRTKEKMRSFENTAMLYDGISSLAKTCDIIISIVSDDKAINAISYGEEGLIHNMKPGSVHICLSTIAPSTSESLNAGHAAKQIEYVTATIIGRPDAAMAYNLTICISGKTSRKALIQEILKDLGGKNLYDFGEDPKSAAVIKVANNFLILAALEAMGEAFNLVTRAGADANAFYQMITETFFSAPIYKNYGKIILDKSYDKAGFSSQLGFKDTKLALSLADEVSTTLPIADLLKNKFVINHNRGRNQWDWISIVKVIEEENGDV
jgi:3-hydroxyisobutyrate dehydrogenase-like beta-hydroxyacid dehydrogenase